MRREQIIQVVGAVLCALLGVAFTVAGIYDSEGRAVVLPLGLLCLAGGIYGTRSALAALKAPPDASGSFGGLGGAGGGFFAIMEQTQAIGAQLVLETPPDWNRFDLTLEPDAAGGYRCVIKGPGGKSFQPSRQALGLVAALAKKSGPGPLCRLNGAATRQPNGEWSFRFEPG